MLFKHLLRKRRSGRTRAALSLLYLVNLVGIVRRVEMRGRAERGVGFTLCLLAHLRCDERSDNEAGRPPGGS